MASPNADVNDLPRDERERERWFEWCASAARLEPKLVGHVSKHAALLDQLATERGFDPQTYLRVMLDWVRGTETAIPRRASSPSRIADAIEAWHSALLRGCHDLDPDLVFPAPPHLAVHGDFVATPITNVGQLYAEGRTMRHCVGALAPRVLAGELAIFHVVVRSEPVTVAVGRDPLGWHLVEATGFENRMPDAVDEIGAWVSRTRRGP
jgi:hypothetical protein